MIDISDGFYDDKEWEALNPVGFRYGSAGPIDRSDYGATILNLDLKGFLNRYSMSAVEEDKAEVFSYMMVNGKELEQHAAADPIIHAKMQRMKQMLKEFCPDVDEQFWQAARNIPRPSDWPVKGVPVKQTVLSPIDRTHRQSDALVFTSSLWAALSAVFVLILVATRWVYRLTHAAK